MLSSIIVGLWLKASSVTDAAYRLTRTRALAVWGLGVDCESEKAYLEYIELTKPGFKCHGPHLTLTYTSPISITYPT